MLTEALQPLTEFFKDLSPLSSAIASNVVVIGIFGWLAQRWASKRLEAMRLQNSQELEKTKSELAAMREELKSNIDKRMMVFQTHFELEFSHFKRLWEMCDEALDYAASVPHLYEVTWLDEETKQSEKERSVAMYDCCRVHLNNARKMRPFIPTEVADASKEMLRICVEITQEYMSVYKFMHEDREDGGYWDRKPARDKAQEDFGNAQRKYDEVASLISNRISSLYALNPDEGR